MNPKTTIAITLTMAGALGVAGCGPSEEPKAPTQVQAPVAQAAPAMPAAEPNMVEKAMQAAKDATQTANARLQEATKAATEAADVAVAKSQEITAAAVEKGKEITAVAVEQTKAVTDAAVVQTKALTSAALEQTKAATSAALEESKVLATAAGDKTAALIQQAKDYIAQNQPELAKGVMDQLSKVKESVPEGVKVEIARLEALMGQTPAAAPTGTAPQAPTPVQ